LTFSWGVWQWYNDTQWSSGVEWQCFTLISNAVIIWCGSSWHVLLVFRTSHSSFCWRPSVCALVLFRTFASSLRFYLIGHDLHLYYLGILGRRVKTTSRKVLWLPWIAFAAWRILILEWLLILLFLAVRGELYSSYSSGDALLFRGGITVPGRHYCPGEALLPRGGITSLLPRNLLRRYSLSVYHRKILALCLPMVILRPGYCGFGIAPSPADLRTVFPSRMKYLQLLLFVSPSVLGVLTLTAALFWFHYKRMEVEPLRLMLLLDLLYSNEMSQHSLGLWIPYSWYMSQHIQKIFRMDQTSFLDTLHIADICSI